MAPDGGCQNELVRTSRLEAFSDGVLAIIITIMVLEIKVPDGADLGAISGSATGFLTYLLSFVYIGIYWNNHHHMFQVVDRINGTVLWGNLHLLFWLSMLPVTTAWLDESSFARTPVIVYGINLLLAAVAYYLVQLAIFSVSGGSGLSDALGRDLKGKFSPVLYLSGIALCFAAPWLGMAVFTGVALMWLIPDRRVERYLEAREAGSA
jgi:TMEM175 potassium channel family protein